MILLSKPIAILGVLLLFFVNQHNLFLLIISIILRAVGFMSSGLNFQILISESSDESKNGLGHIFGVMAFIYFVSTIGGAIFVNRTGFDYNIYFMIFFIVCIILWIRDFIFISDIDHLKKNVRIQSNKKDWRELFKNPKVRSAMIFLTVDFLVWGISGSILAAGLQSQYGFTLKDLAYFQMFFSISNMIFQIPAGKLTDKIGKKKTLIICEISGLLIYGLHIVTFIFWSLGNEAFLFPSMIAIQILFGITVTTFIPSEMMILTDLDESRKGESYGMVNFVRGFGAIPPGIIGGFLMGSVHFIAPFIFTIIGITFLILYLLKFGHNFEENEAREAKDAEELKLEKKIDF